MTRMLFSSHDTPHPFSGYRSSKSTINIIKPYVKLLPWYINQSTMPQHQNNWGPSSWLYEYLCIRSVLINIEKIIIVSLFYADCQPTESRLAIPCEVTWLKNLQGINKN